MLAYVVVLIITVKQIRYWHLIKKQDVSSKVLLQNFLTSQAKEQQAPRVSQKDEKDINVDLNCMGLPFPIFFKLTIKELHILN